jgi:hypothetical protein
MRTFCIVGMTGGAIVSSLLVEIGSCYLPAQPVLKPQSSILSSWDYKREPLLLA